VQMQAFLANDLWRTLARQANGMADLLAKRLSAIGRAPVWPVEANLVFAVISRDAHDRLQAAGARYYVMQSNSLPESVKIASDSLLIRLVTAFSTTEADIDRFVVIAQG
jgi:threonine aldolase